jgi:hypothetical protein
MGSCRKSPGVPWVQGAKHPSWRSNKKQKKKEAWTVPSHCWRLLPPHTKKIVHAQATGTRLSRFNRFNTLRAQQYPVCRTGKNRDFSRNVEALRVRTPGRAQVGAGYCSFRRSLSATCHGAESCPECVLVVRLRQPHADGLSCRVRDARDSITA